MTAEVMDKAGRGGYQQDRGAQRHGRLVGRASGDGTIEGLWLQAESDHPCNRQREGTYSWGEFVITGAGSRRPLGFWGYCGERPGRPWNLEPR